MGAGVITGVTVVAKVVAEPEAAGLGVVELTESVLLEVTPVTRVIGLTVEFLGGLVVP